MFPFNLFPSICHVSVKCTFLWPNKYFGLPSILKGKKKIFFWFKSFLFSTSFIFFLFFCDL
ncbi:unnamed protein product [Meloidogyne enterolobii]|uniref:Uncharacterized protein n=1 Tax=Meloidogyne enterolobii TaxID=390850 RepID=A0ACB0ZXN3_MELEN